MAKRQQTRRVRQRRDNEYNQFVRGQEMFMPIGTSGEYADVYPMVSRRGRIMYDGKSSFELRRAYP
jgi:hypothetical protein